jgi:VanZ family protein
MFLISFIFSFKLWLRKTIAAIYLGIIAVLSLMPARDLPHITVFQSFDKMVHFSMYFGLSFLACWSLEINRNRMKPIYLLLLSVFLYGVLMEILQRTMHNGRNFEFRDMIANLTGAVVGILVFRYFDKKRIEADFASLVKK